MMRGIVSRVSLVISMTLLFFLAACGPNCPDDPAYRYDPKTNTCIDLFDLYREEYLASKYTDSYRNYLADKYDPSIFEFTKKNDYLDNTNKANDREDLGSKSDSGNESDEIWYTVKRGDTLSKISAAYGVSVKEIAQANGLLNPNRIYPGQKLRIPSPLRSAPLSSTSGAWTVLSTIQPTMRPSTPTPRPPMVSTQVPQPKLTRPSTGCPQGCTTQPSGCFIKGNISYTTRERIYHVPGCQYYEQTKISPEYGERWFCTEAEAIANGWRKAKNCP